MLEHFGMCNTTGIRTLNKKINPTGHKPGSFFNIRRCPGGFFTSLGGASTHEQLYDSSHMPRVQKKKA